MPVADPFWPSTRRSPVVEMVTFPPSPAPRVLEKMVLPPVRFSELALMLMSPARPDAVAAAVVNIPVSSCGSPVPSMEIPAAVRLTGPARPARGGGGIDGGRGQRGITRQDDVDARGICRAGVGRHNHGVVHLQRAGPYRHLAAARPARVDALEVRRSTKHRQMSRRRVSG